MKFKTYLELDCAMLSLSASLRFKNPVLSRKTKREVYLASESGLPSEEADVKVEEEDGDGKNWHKV